MRKNYNIEETCELLNISKAMLYKLWRLGIGPKVTKIGRRTFVSHNALDKWLQDIEQNGSKSK